MAKPDRKRAGDDKSPALSVAPSQAMFIGVGAAAVLASKGKPGAINAIEDGKKMRRAGERQPKIHQETGVTFGKDRLPRVELSDHKARMSGTVPKTGSVFLKDVFKHDSLYEAVPTAQHLTLARGPADMRAEASVSGNHIDLNPKYFSDVDKRQLSVSADAIPTLLHEIQHHVQDVEGFADGGSPDDFKTKFPNDEKARKQAYKELAGEVEARLTANRAGLTPTQRREFYPHPDIPLSQQRIDPHSNGERNFLDFQGVKDAASNAFQQLFNKDMADNKPARFRKLDPRQIKSDPNTFQFKSGGDSHGVTDRLKGVKSWDNVAAGKAVVFERANGELVIADGHQRLGLAKRLAGEGQKINMDAYVLRERDGWSPRDVYAYAALKNIKESSGQALDMAKVMRERPDLVNGSVPMSDAKVREAANLAKLSKPAFDMVVGGAIKPEYAAQVGARIGDTSRHVDMLTEMAKANVGSAQHAGLYVDQALAAGSITQHQNSLFGEETNTRSLIAERAAVLDKALSSLKSDKRIFALLEREAGTIEDAGNKLSHDTNAARASEAGNTAALVERLAKNRGPVSDMLEIAARQMAEGKKPQVAARGFVKAVGDTLKAGGMRALTGDAPEMHQMVNQNQTSMFSIEPKSAGDHHVWDDKARAASADVRKAKANGKMAKSPVRMMIDDGQGDMMPKATTKDKIAAESRKKAAKGRTGDPADHGLFSSARDQSDIVDAVKAHRTKQTKAETDGLRDSSGNLWKKHPGTDAWSVQRVDDEVKRIEPSRKPFSDVVRQTNKAPAMPTKTPKSGKRGTQNEANLKAINANRKAKAKGPSKALQAQINRAQSMNVEPAKEIVAGGARHLKGYLDSIEKGNAKRKSAKGDGGRGRLEARAAQLNAKAPMNTLDLVTGGVGDDRPMWKRQGITRLPKGLAFNGDRVVVSASNATGANGRTDADRVRRYTNRMKAAGTAKTDAELRTEALTKPSSGVADRMRAKMNAPAEPAPAAKAKRGVGKAAGILAPIAIGAAMILASSKAKAEGMDTGGQIKEAAKEGVKGGATMAGFTVGTAAVTGGLMRAGMTAAKAIPATSIALMGFGAVSEGIAAFRHGEGASGIAKAAAKGAWDMSLPGMVVNTGVAVHDAFDAANSAYRAPAKGPSSPSGDGASRRGWANPTVQAAAQAAKGRTFNGFTRGDLR